MQSKFASNLGESKEHDASMIILPKVSVDGVAKVGLMQSRGLNAKVVALIKERRLFPTLAENLDVSYLTRSEVLSRMRYDRYVDSLDIGTRKFIIAHNVTGGVVAYRLHKRLNIPYIIYMHDARYSSIPGTLPRFNHEDIIQSLTEAKAILTNSMRTANELDELYSIKGTPLYPGAVSSAEMPQNRGDYILYVHSIGHDARGDFDILLAFLDNNKQSKMIIAGAKRYGWQIIYIKFKRRFGNRVLFVFNPTEQELTALYQRSKLLIHPAVENFGLSPLEAAGQGTPSIVAKGSGVLEVLGDGREVLSFDGTFEHLQSIFLNNADSTLGSIGRHAFERARQHDWDTHTNLLQEHIAK